MHGCVHPCKRIYMGLCMSASCISHCLLAFAFLYIFVLYHLPRVCMGFAVDAFRVVFCCLCVSLRVLGSLCACSSICTCDQLSPGSLSLCGFCVCASMSRGSFPSCITPVCLWMEADWSFSSLGKMMGLDVYGARQLSS